LNYCDRFPNALDVTVSVFLSPELKASSSNHANANVVYAILESPLQINFLGVSATSTDLSQSWQVSDRRMEANATHPYSKLLYTCRK